MHQFEWLSEGEGNFLNLLQKEGVPRIGGFPQKREWGERFQPWRKLDCLTLKYSTELLKLIESEILVFNLK